MIRAAFETATGVFELWRNTYWDTSAGQAVLEAAGGMVLVASSGKRLSSGKPGFIAVSETEVIQGEAK